MHPLGFLVNTSALSKRAKVGEIIVLFAPDGEVMDSVTLPLCFFSSSEYTDSNIEYSLGVDSFSFISYLKGEYFTSHSF